MSIKPLRLPPKDLSRLTLEAKTLAVEGWIRLHLPGRAVLFTKNPEHRFTPVDTKYGVLYIAQDEETAALEVYGDRLYRRKQGRIDKNDWEARQFSKLALPAVKVADLTYGAMPTARVDLTALTHRSRSVTHAWGAAVMNHPGGFHGLLYLSRFTGKICVALFAVPGDPTPVVSGSPFSFHSRPIAYKLEKNFEIALT
jgi:hypothetical protein